MIIELTLDGAPAATALFERKAAFAGGFLRKVGREAIDAVKEDIEGEIRGQYYLAGGRRAWEKTKAFGDLPANRPALQSYARKWAGAAPVISADSAEISVTIPGGAAHVGGSGTERSEGGVAIRAKGDPRRMQGAIWRKTGAFVSRKTLTGTGLHLPSRPHANPDNPTTARKVELVMARGFEGV